LDNENSIIDLNSRRKELDGNADEEGYEDWEDDYELISNEDYEGLKKLRQMMVENNPEDIYAQWRLGEAYVLCKEYEKAIDYLKPLYINNPDNEDIQHLILDALFALGKSEKDFNWISTPKILRLNGGNYEFLL
jgi:tetratricopeptide (TPR) repeat protein